MADSAPVLPACPVCGAAARAWRETRGHLILDCTGCTHRWCALDRIAGHVDRHYDDAYFEGGGAGYVDYLGQRALQVDRGRRYGRLLRRHAPGGGRLLDVGAAAGFVLRGFIDAGWQGRGLEPNAAMVRHGCEVEGVELQRGTLEDLGEEGAYDAVALVQVIAHFPDVGRAVATAARALRPGGLCLVETWDRDSIAARLQGLRWHEYSPPTVLHWFSRPTLAALGGRHGLQVVATGRPLRWLTARHALSLVAHMTGRQVPVALWRAVPEGLRLPYPPVDLFWTILRKT